MKKHNIFIAVHYRYILSVAHCFISNNKPANIYALVGDQDISTGADTPFSALYTIEAIINHESYNPNSATNAFDIALLRTVNYIKYKRGK